MANDDNARLQEENEKLTEENEQLNDDDWVIDNHKALKYKIVLTEEYYAEITAENEELEEENEQLKEFALGYWSAGQLGNCEAWDRPDEWQEQLDTLP